MIRPQVCVFVDSSLVNTMDVIANLSHEAGVDHDLHVLLIGKPQRADLARNLLLGDWAQDLECCGELPEHVDRHSFFVRRAANLLASFPAENREVVALVDLSSAPMDFCFGWLSEAVRVLQDDEAVKSALTVVSPLEPFGRGARNADADISGRHIVGAEQQPFRCWITSWDFFLRHRCPGAEKDVLAFYWRSMAERAELFGCFADPLVTPIF